MNPAIPPVTNAADKANSDRTPSSARDGLTFHERHRPRRFADVIGQNDVVRRLKEAIARPEQKHFLISGPLGTGKTTCAQLIERALNCTSPIDGDSCGICASCRVIDDQDRSGLIKINASSRAGNKAPLQERIDEIRRYGGSVFAFQNVLLVDEAQGLSSDACDLLLEELNPTCGFIAAFTLIEEAKLRSDALRSRCHRLSLRPPTIKDRVAYLERICTAENLASNREALQLIAERHPDFRNVANELEAVAAATSSIDVDAVQDILIRTETAPYLQYLEHLIEGDLGAQLQTINSIPATPGEKLTSIGRLLLHIKTTCVGPTILVSPPLAALAYDPSTCRSMTERLNDIARAFGKDLTTFFSEILDYWKRVPHSPTAVSAEMHLVEFHDLLSVAKPQSVQNLAPFDPTNMKRRPAGVRRGKVGDAGPNGHLDYEQAAEIYEASTFLMQEHKLSFDAAIEIRMTEFGVDRPTPAAVLLTDLCRNLRQYLLRKGVEHHRISALREQSDGVVGTVVFCMPASLESECRAWISRFVAPKLKQGGNLDRAINLEVCHQTAPKRRIDWHWTRIRDIWADVDPNQRIIGKGRLVDLLQIPPRNLRRARPLAGRRLHYSQSIGRSARAAAAAEHLEHVSVFREQEWDQLFTGWEFKEHGERQAERQRRSKRIAGLTEKLEASASPLACTAIEHEIENEKSSWRQTARFRARTQAIWGSLAMSGDQQGEYR